MEKFEFEENLLKGNACSIQPHVNNSYESKQTLEILWWTNVIILPSIAVIGLACNFINILVLTTNKVARRIPAWHLLVSLAFFDSLFLIFATFEITPISIQIFLTSSILNLIYTKLALYIRTCASTFYKASILIVVAFNVERYLSVCKPLWAHRFCTTRNNYCAILFCFGISFLCSIQWPIVYEVVECYDAIRIHSYSLIIMRQNKKLQTYYKLMDYLSLTLFNLLPIGLLCILNLQLVKTLKQVVNQDLRRNSGSNEPMILLESTMQRYNANAMLFAVVFLLVICIGPQAPARLLYDYYGHYHKTAVLYTCISQQMVFLNASLNFCLYCLVSKRYRLLLRETVHQLCIKLDELGFNFPFFSINNQIRLKVLSLFMSLSPNSQTISSAPVSCNQTTNNATIYDNNLEITEEHPMLERRASAPPLNV